MNRSLLRKGSRLALVVAAAGLLGCAPTHYVYAPTSTTGSQLEGAPAATYDVLEGEHRGEVRVAMLGVSSLKTQGLQDSTLLAVHVAFALSNPSDDAWRFDPSESHVDITAQREHDVLYATTVDVARPTVLDVPQHSTRLIDLYFPLPLRFQKGRDPVAVEVHWSVHTRTATVTRRTVFQRFLEGPPGVSSDLSAEPLNDDAPLPGALPPDWRRALPPVE